MALSNSRMLIFINVLKKVSACVVYIIYITQITFKLVDNVLMINENLGVLSSVTLIDILPTIFLLVNAWRSSLLIFSPRS